MKDPTAPEIKPIEPKPVILNPATSALLVLEMSGLCADPEYMAAPLVPGIIKLLERARAAGTLIVFTIPKQFIGQPHGQVHSEFKRKQSEAVISLPVFDKFADGQLQNLLNLFGIETLVLTGCKANMAVLYTASRAVIEYKYNIIIPVDGIAATTEYEKEYTLYQFRAYPGGLPKRFTFSTLDTITFETIKQ